MKNNQRISARLRLAGRGLAGLAVAALLAFAVTFSAAGAPPDNDNFANAITLTAASTDTTTDEATTETGEPGVAAPLQFANVNTSRTVWWKWTAPSTAKYTFAVTSAVTDPTIGVFTGSSVNSLTELASSADADHDTGYESRIFLDATSGTDYYVQVGVTPADTSGAFTLTWAANSVSNDDFVNAIALGSDDGHRPGWNVGATVQPPDEPGTTSCCIDHTVWYAYTPSVSGSVDLELDTDFPSDLNVYTGSTLAGLHFVSGTGRIDVDGGTTYFIQIGTSDGGPGTFLLSWALDATPLNDDFASADDLFGGQTLDGRTIGASTEPGEPTSVNGHSGVRSVWYQWFPEGSGPATVSVDAVQDVLHAPLVQLYATSSADPTFADLTPIGTHDPGVNDPVDTVHATVDGTAVYYIQVLGDLTAEQDVSFDFTLSAQFDNDLFADATQISGTNNSITGTTVGATFPESSEPDPSGAIDNTVWYAWTAPANGPATFSVDTGFDGAAAVYTGGAVDSLVPVSDDADSSALSLPFTAQAGQTYHVQVGTYDDSPGTFTLHWQLTVRPSNDDLADATTIDGSSIEGSTNNATLEASEPTDVDVSGTPHTGSHSVWYRWSPGETGAAELTVTPDVDIDHPHSALVQLYAGPATVLGFDDLTPVGTHPSADTTDADVETGSFYYVQVMSNDTPNPNFGFTLDLEVSVPAPGNDDFEDATALDGNSGSLGDTNAGAGLELDEPDPSGGDTTATVWYDWTPTSSGRATVSFGASFLGSLAVYTGAAVDSLSPVASDYDGTTLDASFNAVAGATYHVQVGSYFDSPGAFTLGWSIAPPGHYVVTTTGDTVGDANCLVSSCTLRQAVNAADAGGGADTIDVPAGTYQLSGSFGALDVTAGMTITGAGARTTTILAPARDRVLDVTAAARPVAVTGFTLTGGTADENNGCFGGDVRSSGDLTLTEVAVTGGSACSGGGLSNVGGTMLIVRSTVTGNQALLGGGDSGGIQNFGDNQIHHGALTIRNSTITGNTARLGGAILSWNDQANTVVVENSTIAGNTATDRGIGGIGGDGSFSFKGSIVAGNVFVNGPGGPSNCSGTIVSLGGNLESGTDCGFTATGDIRNADPLLRPLADNGGPTDTLALPATSPAVDALAGCPPPSIDQRGTARPQGASCDIGAFELVPGPAAPGAPTLSTATPGNGSVALEWLPPEQNGGTPITGYLVYRGTSSGGEELLTQLGNVTTYTDPSVTNGTTYFYEVAAVNGVGVGALSNERSATPTAPQVRDIAGSVLGANGAAVAGVAVRACLGLTCLGRTTDANGGFAFLGIAPGVYVVRALPSDPSVLAVQTDADVRDQSREVVLRLTASGAGSTDAGPSSFRVTGCQGGTLHYVATGDGVSLGNGDVADGANGTPVDGVYTIDVSSLNLGHAAMLQLDITIICSDTSERQTALLFADPSGTVVDDTAGGAVLPGATVTLLDAAGNPIAAGDPRLSPATSANPQTSDARGAWGWDVAPGTYRVSATNATCGSTTSATLTVTPTNPVTNVVLHLACPGPPVPTPPNFPPTPPTPPTTLPDPIAGVNFNVVPIAGTVLVNGQVLPNGQQIPFGADIDATNGIVSITTIGPDGKPQTAFFYGGEFILTLDPDGVTTLVLKGGDFSVCGTTTTTKTKVKGTKKRKTQAVAAKAKAASKKVIRAVWGTGKGSFRTKGRYSSATVRGTLWYHADRCDGTYTQVNEGVVSVLDFAHKKILIVRAGHSVLVRPK